MYITVVAATDFNPAAARGFGYQPHPDVHNVHAADELAEFAGRMCYQSWDRPNPATSTNHGYLNNIIRQKHFSVLEHASVTFGVDGVSRALLTELSRHRMLSLSVLSQRYVYHGHLEGMDSFIIPLILDEVDAEACSSVIQEMSVVREATQKAYQRITEILEDQGVAKKDVRDAARYALPEAAGTAFVVTGNLRAWREVVEKRSDPAAAPEIREFASNILAHLKVVAPSTFQDFH